MNSSIAFIRIANHVEVTVDLKGKRVSWALLLSAAILLETSYRN